MDRSLIPNLVFMGTATAVLILAFTALALIRGRMMWVSDAGDKAERRGIARLGIFFGYVGLIIAALSALGAYNVGDTHMALRLTLIVAVALMIIGHYGLLKISRGQHAATADGQ